MKDISIGINTFIFPISFSFGQNYLRMIYYFLHLSIYHNDKCKRLTELYQTLKLIKYFLFRVEGCCLEKVGRKSQNLLIEVFSLHFYAYCFDLKFQDFRKRGGKIFTTKGGGNYRNRVSSSHIILVS